MFLFVDIYIDILVKSAELLSIWKFDIIPVFDDLIICIKIQNQHNQQTK